MKIAQDNVRLFTGMVAEQTSEKVIQGTKQERMFTGKMAESFDTSISEKREEANTVRRKNRRFGEGWHSCRRSVLQKCFGTTRRKYNAFNQCVLASLDTPSDIIEL